MKNNKRLTVILLCVLLALLGFLIYSVVTIEMEDERAIEEYDTYDSILYFNEVNNSDIEDVEVTFDESVSITELTPEEIYFDQIKIQKGINWTSFRNTNQDFVGVVSIPEMDIWYPMVQNAEDNSSYYLNHTYAKKKNAAGAIFLDYLFSKDFSDNHSIMFGHNMKNMTMFGSLRTLIENEWTQPVYMYIYTPEQILIYRIYAAYLTTPGSYVYNAQLTDNLYAQYYEQTLEDASYLDVDSEVEEAYANMNNLMTLSTCHASDHSDYTIVQSILIERIIVKDEENN